MTAPSLRAGPGASAAPAIRMRGIEKSFGSVHANRGVDFEVASGEIHALVGENGAGKSTLMRILSGMFRADAGTFAVEGRTVTGWSTTDAIAAGVGMVHQHFMLVPTLTVAENVVLGRESRRGLRFDRHRAEHDVDTLAQHAGLTVRADRRVADLSVGEAQRVEIIKTLFRGARILLLDEPTAVLSPGEVRDLWAVLRRMRDGGGTIVLITHKLDEVMDLSDAVTVMRHGRTVAKMPTSTTTAQEIARAMVGREVALVDVAPRAAAPVPDLGVGPALDVRDLVVASARTRRAVDDVSFTIAPGEILGIAGVEGNGQTELIEAIAGLRAIVTGSVWLGGSDITAQPVRTRVDAGLSHIPEDRHRRGLILDYSVADNLILGSQHRYAHRGVLDRARIASHARERIAEFDIRPGDPALPARALSGGNQQKIVVAREMGSGRDFRVLLAAQPTRGVDVGAIQFIHSRLRAARAAGKGILLVSAELSEILALADRIAVMYGGVFAAMMPRSQANEEVLGQFMTGAARARGA